MLILYFSAVLNQATTNHHHNRNMPLAYRMQALLWMRIPISIYSRIPADLLITKLLLTHRPVLPLCMQAPYQMCPLLISDASPWRR